MGLNFNGNPPAQSEPYSQWNTMNIFKMWNRAITVEEMDAEWNADKGRFGL